MSWTSRGTIICDWCGRFCNPVDDFTPHGAVYDSDGSFEPHDPEHICINCWPTFAIDMWEKYQKTGQLPGDWIKSRAENAIAKRVGLVWSNGVGMLGTENWADPHQYITKAEYNRLKKLPYYGYCDLCGTARKGGYCSDDDCEKSFKSKVAPSQANYKKEVDK